MQMWLGFAVLWLWPWPAAAAPMQPLAWELPGAAIKKKKRKNLHLHSFSIKAEKLTLRFLQKKKWGGGGIPKKFFLHSEFNNSYLASSLNIKKKKLLRSSLVAQ